MSRREETFEIFQSLIQFFAYFLLCALCAPVTICEVVSDTNCNNETARERCLPHSRDIALEWMTRNLMKWK